VTIRATSVTPIIAAGLGAAGSLFAFLRGRTDPRDVIKKDLDLLAMLPEVSPVRSQLLRHVEDSIKSLIHSEDQLRRDPLSVVLGLIFLALGGYLIYVAYTESGWFRFFYLAAAPFVAFGLYGTITGMKRSARAGPDAGNK
jgi:hypothetical protein